MKIIKPLDLGLLYRTLELNHHYFLVTTGIAFFSFDSPGRLESEINLWPLVSEELGEVAMDTGMPKVGAEYLIKGHFFSPNKTPCAAGTVRVNIGEKTKSLNIFGDRQWQRISGDRWQLSQPALMTELEIAYENAFGGADYLENPIGKGFVKDLNHYRDSDINIPNILSPDQPIRSPDEKMIPAGFAPYDFTWPQRYDKIGTYDDKWLNERFPGFAEDFDPTFLNIAPFDQQFPEKFTGQESFSCENMHPDHQLLESTLPGIRVRCFVNDKENGEVELREISMAPDTLWLFPHRKRGVLFYRGQLEVQDDEASEYKQISLVYENLSDPQRPLSYYTESIAKRLDKKNGHLYALNDKDLIADGASSPMVDIMTAGEGAHGEGLLEKHLKNKSEVENEEAWNRLKEMGLNPDDYKASEENDYPNIDLDSLDRLDELIKKLEADARKAEQQLEETMQQVAESMGKDFNELLKEGIKKGTGPVRFSADEMIEDLKNYGLYEQKKEEKLRELEAETKKVALQYGHFFDPVPEQSEDERQKMRQRVIRAYDRQESLAGKELPGLDLSGLELTGIDLSDCFLEGAIFRKAKLVDVNLSGSMLARSDLSLACLTNVDLTGSNLGKSNLSQAQFVDCAMEKTILYESCLEKALLKNMNIAEGDFSECQAAGATFEEINLQEARFIESRLDKSTFIDCNLNEALFYSADARGGKFSNSSMKEAVFVQFRGDESDFSAANLKNIRTALESSFQEADFSRSNLSGATLRELNLKGCNFTEALLDGADLSKSKLGGSTFYRAVARQAMFIKTDFHNSRMVSVNLMGAILQKSNLEGCDLRGANLYGADLLHVDFSTVLLDQANVEKTLLTKWSGS